MVALTLCLDFKVRGYQMSYIVDGNGNTAFTLQLSYLGKTLTWGQLCFVTPVYTCYEFEG